MQIPAEALCTDQRLQLQRAEELQRPQPLQLHVLPRSARSAVPCHIWRSSSLLHCCWCIPMNLQDLSNCFPLDSLPVHFHFRTSHLIKNVLSWLDIALDFFDHWRGITAESSMFSRVGQFWLHGSSTKSAHRCNLEVRFKNLTLGSPFLMEKCAPNWHRVQHHFVVTWPCFYIVLRPSCTHSRVPLSASAQALVQDPSHPLEWARILLSPQHDQKYKQEEAMFRQN